MDTDLPSFTTPDLFSLLGSPSAPTILDVRRAKAFDDDTRLIPGALRRLPETVDTWAASISRDRRVIAYCVHGHEVSQAVTRRLRERGVDAQFLSGGITGWKESGAPTMTKRPDFGIPGENPSRWVTRERPRIDRIACPWLIHRFIDPTATFLYVPTAQVFDVARSENAVAYDIPGAPIEHDGPNCSFDSMLRAFDLHDAGLDQLAAIVRGADTDRLGLTPQSAGLVAMSIGLSRLHADDQALREQGMLLYDALYAWIRVGQGERHNWQPEAMRA
ncbi:MAG: chromate resistance protein ChrB domain-containing protein [Burkholderiales bacterium]